MCHQFTSVFCNTVLVFNLPKSGTTRDVHVDTCLTSRSDSSTKKVELSLLLLLQIAKPDFLLIYSKVYGHGSIRRCTILRILLNEGEMGLPTLLK